MGSAVWMKLGTFRVNMAHVALIDHDGDRLLFFNATGEHILTRQFESARQAEQALRDFFGYEQVQLVTPRYEGSAVDDETHDEDA